MASRYNTRMSVQTRMVVVLPTWVGDVVMATPTLRALREHFAEAHITLCGSGSSLAVLDGLPWTDSVTVQANRRSRGLSPFFHAVGQLRAGRYDLALLLPNSFRSALIARLAGIPRRAGYARDGRGWLLTDRLEPPRDQDGELRIVPAIEHYAALARMLGVATVSPRMELAVPAQDATIADALLADRGFDSARPLVMLNPGAAYGVSKMWSPERFAEVADALIERDGTEIIVNAAPSERAIARAVVEAMRHRCLLHFADRDNSLGLLKGLLQRCDLLITNDTGARHIAAALGTAIVTLFGSTDPLRAQIDFDRERIVRVDLRCSPCQQRICPQPAGPFYHKCMSDIPPERVIEEAQSLLSDRASREGAAS
jgi:lipopolysaccharide heptosyltransferase II